MKEKEKHIHCRPIATVTTSAIACCRFGLDLGSCGRPSRSLSACLPLQMTELPLPDANAATERSMGTAAEHTAPIVEVAKEWHLVVSACRAPSPTL